MINNKPFRIPDWGENEVKNEGTRFELVPEGETTLTVIDVFPTTFNTGRNGIIFDCEDEEGRQLRHQCMNDFNKDGKTMNRWQLKNTLQVITGELPQPGSATIDPPNLIGRKFRAVVIHEQVWSEKHQREFPKAKIESFVMPEQISPGQTEIEEFDPKADDFFNA